MKRFKCKQLIKALGIALISSTSLYGVTSLNTANAGFLPQLKEHACLAQYSGSHLTCTANDIRVSEVKNVTDPNGNTPVECTDGEMFDFKADFTVVTTATSRYGYGIWLPEGKWSAKDESTTNTCSVLSGDTFGPGINLDGDPCADITKKAGESQVHEYIGETITMLCRDDDGSGKADFNYCASWNQQEYGECSATKPTPAGSPSKCRCDTFDIDVFLKPEAPLITKTLKTSDSVDEPGGVFKYEVKITNTSDKADIFIQSATDIIRSSTDNTVFAQFDLTTKIDTPDGNLTLLATHGDHTCDDKLKLPLKLTPSMPTFSCIIVVKVDDDDLPDDGTDELYQDFIHALVWDKNDAVVGDPNCDPTAPTPINPERATCSNVETVKVQDVDPNIDIVKFSIAGPNWQCKAGSIGSDGKCSGTVYIDEPGGDVTYKLVIKNTSSVDPLTITSLKDVVNAASIDLLTNISGNSCDDSLPINLAIAGETGDTFECTFVRDVSGALGTVKNIATVIASEKNGHSEGNTATKNDFAEVTIINVAPTVVFNKLVSTDGITFAKSVQVDEPGGDVVYKFSVMNTSPAKETIRLLSLTDPVLDGSRVTPNAGGTCVFDGSVSIAYNATYSCTFPANVTGEPNNQLDNTAFVTITDEESNINSNTSSATVTFKDIPANANLTVNLSTRVFVTVKNLSTFEDIKLTHLKIAGFNIEDLDLTHYNIINDGFTGFAGDGHTYDACHQPSASAPQTIAKNDAYRCSFRVEVLTDTDTAPNLLSHLGGPVPTEPSGILTIKVEDFDGGAVQDKDATVYVHLEPSQ